MSKERFEEYGGYIYDNNKNHPDDELLIEEVCKVLNQQAQKIVDLEAKLTEKQKLLEDSVDVHETEEKDIYKLRYELAGATETIEVLKQQLEEKESEIKVGEFWHSAYQGKQLDYDKVYSELRKSYDEIEKLKQQLAEKEQIIKEMEQEIDGRDKRIDRLEENYHQETRQLEWVNEQLTEKEKQVNTYAKEIVFLDKKIEDVKNSCDFYINRANDLLIKHQDKISFAVEQLEKVKEWVIKSVEEFSCVYEEDMLDTIDNQIRQLKEGK